MVDPMVHNPLLSQLIAGFGLFVGSLIVLTIVTGIVARSVRSSALSPIDRTLGFIFGLAARRVYRLRSPICCSMSACRRTTGPAGSREAKSAPYLQQGAEMLRRFCPNR